MCLANVSPPTVFRIVPARRSGTAQNTLLNKSSGDPWFVAPAAAEHGDCTAWCSGGADTAGEAAQAFRYHGHEADVLVGECLGHGFWNAKGSIGLRQPGGRRPMRNRGARQWFSDRWLFRTMRGNVRIALSDQDFDTLCEHGVGTVTIKARR